VGTLQSLIGRDMDLKYAADGSTLQRAVIMGDAILQLAARRRTRPADLREDAGRDARAGRHDADALKGQDAVELSFPAEQSGAARTIKAASVDAVAWRGKALRAPRSPVTSIIGKWAVA